MFSPAKINLGLRIVGRRPDGYHLLESLFWPIDLKDDVFISKNSKNTIQMEWAEDAPIQNALPLPEENSLSKLLMKAPQVGTWAIHIKKRIPIGGGLGGSSSNVGRVLKFFQEEKLLSQAETERLALSLGADVPYFLNPVPTWVEGIGEKRTPLPTLKELNPFSFVLLLFEKPCDTKEIFTQYRKSQVPFSQRYEIPSTWTSSYFKTYLKSTENDLEAFARRAVPEIKEGLALLRGFDFDAVGLSGSGSTCFAASLYDTAPKISTKDLQAFCRKYNCKYTQVTTFGA